MTEIHVKPALRRRLEQHHEKVDGRKFRRAVQAALTWLQTNKEVVNALNVFPVPDGDTGTNMVLTMQEAWAEIENRDDPHIGRVAHALAHGALMGARGNSGVILSQLWRGIARALEGCEVMTAEALARALAEARDTAYKGVVRPVEGTILTVAKDVAAAAEAAVREGTTSVLAVLERVVEAADRSVERTPDLLPVLKEAGVVDSGGKGLFFILEGMLRSAYGLPLDEPVARPVPLRQLNLQSAHEAIEPGQDWEVVVDFRPQGPLDMKTFYEGLERMGTSIQVGEGDGLIRMHIHVSDGDQYKPIEYIRRLGTITRVAMENLMVQTAETTPVQDAYGLHLEHVVPGRPAVVVVAPGPGLARVFASLGAAAVVRGGQSMNPSTQDILTAIENLPTDQVLLLPNNKNVLLAAKQAAELTVKRVEVVPTVSVPQGIAALLKHDAVATLDDLVQAMTGALGEVRSGELTIATRDAEIEGVAVRKGQVIGLLDGHLVAAAEDLETALLHLLEAGEAEEAEVITLYYGEDLTTRQANRLADRVREAYPGHEIEVIEGGQPHYHLILSIE